ncbi:hypothetical protein [Haloarcula sediminis]|uniref:hypothetical protein n=1 Tax=Haloarcula sediminis TaxID=3111777 RepID=UPI002D780796|nr:hypothetical protein [Haloarcula sp. CK38]
MKDESGHRRAWLTIAQRLSTQKQKPLVNAILQHDFPVTTKQELVGVVERDHIGHDYPPATRDLDTYGNHAANESFQKIERLGLVGHLPHEGRRPNVLKVNPELRHDLVEADLPLIQQGREERALFDPPAPEEWDPSIYRDEEKTLAAIAEAATAAAAEMKSYVGQADEQGRLARLGETDEDAAYGDGIPRFGLEVLLYGRIATFLADAESPRVEFEEFEVTDDGLSIVGALTADELRFESPDQLDDGDGLDIKVPTAERIRSAVRETLVTLMADAFYRPDETDSIENIVRWYEPGAVEVQAEDRGFDSDSLEVLVEGEEIDPSEDPLSDAEWNWFRVTRADISVTPDEDANQVQFELALSSL